METEKILLDVEFDQTQVQQAITSIQQYNVQIETLKQSQKELEVQGQKNSTQYIQQQAAIKALGNEVRTNQRLVEANATAQRKTEGYLNSLKKSIQELTVQYDRLSKEELENADVGGKLANQIKSQSDELKRLKANIGDNRLSVGAYKEGIIEAGKQINIAGINVGNTFKDISEINEKFFGTMAQGFKESGLQARLFGTTMRTALTVSGIGLFLIALGTIVAYWEDIAVAIGIADSAQEKHFQNQLKNIETTKDLLEQYNKELDAQNQILETQGNKEQEIFSNRRKSLLLDIELARQSQRLIGNRITSYLQENGLTEESLKLRVQAAKVFGQKDPFAERVGELKKQFDEASQSVVNLNNQLSVLDAQQNKFNDEQAKKAEEDRAKNIDKRAKQLHDQYQKQLDQEAEFNSQLAELRGNQADDEKAQLDQQLHDLAEADRKRAKSRMDANSDINQSDIDAYNRQQQINKAKEESDQAYLNAAKNIAGAIAGLFDQGTAENKAFATAQIGIDTAQAISALAKYSEENPFNAETFGAAGIATYAAGIVRIINNIAAAKRLLNFAKGGLVDPVIEGFSGGGLSGTRIMGYHGRPITRANGDNRLATVKVGEVILNERQQSALGGSRTFKAIGVPGFAGGGFIRRDVAARVDQASLSRVSPEISSMRREFSNLKIYTRLTDINKAQSKAANVKVISELRKN